MSAPRVRELVAADLPSVLELNQSARPHVSDLELDALCALVAEAAYVRGVTRDGRLLAFLIAFAPDAHYESPNFQWFRARYDRFVYVDRIVVAAGARGEGIGKRLYDDVAAFARERAPRVTCEVNLRPRNDGSLRFHAREGFVQVGEQETEGGKKSVALLARELG